MPSKTYTVLTLLVTSSAAFAWQPLTYPIRSQSPYERSVDNAMCFAEAGRVSKVDIRREPQIPPRPAPAAKGSSTGAPAKPPLPPSSFSATPLPYAPSVPDGASMPTAAAPTGASSAKSVNAAAPTGASSAKSVDEAIAGAAAAAARASATAAAGASAAQTTAAAGASDGLGASDASLQANAASDVKLPPLPAPEPPMQRYWAAYAACMQQRGYVVNQ
jgi:hypothetical protein